MTIAADAIPQLNPPKSAHVIQSDQIVITFGPIDLPTHHSGELAASLPPHIFTVPEDRYVVGYDTTLFSEDSLALPNEYLHHFLILDMKKESLSCPGEMYFVGGSGMEMGKAVFPSGYGVNLAKQTTLMSVIAFYHNTPAISGVYATLTLHTVSGGADLQTLEAYPVGVNTNCYTKYSARSPDETEEGILLKPGTTIRSAPVQFQKNGCVKFAYPHGHDHLVLFTLENRTSQATLLRTVPAVTPEGKLVGFTETLEHTTPLPLNFPVNATDHYQMTMIYHRPLHEKYIGHGMANYILYMTLGTC